MITKNFYQKTFLRGFSRKWWYNLREFYSISRRIGYFYFEGNSESKVLVFVTSKNQKKYLSSIREYCGENLLLVAFDARLLSGDNEVHKARISSPWRIYVGFSQFNVYLRFWSNVLGKKTNIDTVVLLNDHLPPFLALFSAASTKRLRTVYHQHAFVSSIFPRIFVDEAILFGSWSEHLYLHSKRTIGVSKDAFKVTFTPPVFGKVVRHNNRCGLGIATNSITDRFKLLQLVSNLEMEKIFLAPHPGESQKRINSYKQSLSPLINVEIVDSNWLLANCETVLLGNTGLLFDCILNDVQYKYVDIDGLNDYYSVNEFEKFCEMKDITFKRALGYE